MPKTEFTTVKGSDNLQISDNAKTIFLKRFVLRKEDGSPAETIDEAIYRVGSHVANGEKSKKLREKYTELFSALIKERRFIANSPTWSGSKTPLGQLAACFVLPILDDMGRKRGGIFDTLKNAALIQQTGGGNGFSFSNLRPKGDYVKGSNGFASGPISFLEAYDIAFGHIAQGGTRRGANMAVMRVDHPDILDFIKCKSQEGKVSNFNISVGITDEFIEALKNDKDFDLRNPRDNKVWKTVKAKEIMSEIVKYAYKNGEPGILFLDAANRQNPVPNQYVLEATNPCGEQWLGPYENCCLGHVNINASIINNKVDWDHLRESVILGTRFLDDVVTQNAYVPSVPELKEAAFKNRRIGLGFLGLADAMYALGIRYGSKESLDFASQITEFIRFHAMKTSIELAIEKGPFPGITGSIYDPKNLKWTIPTPLIEHKKDLGRPAINWSSILRDLKKYGIRNSTVLTVAPTGTTSTVFDVEGYGCEPVFALAYYRNVYQSAGNQEGLRLTYVSPQFQKALDSSKVSEDVKKKIIEYAIDKGTIQDLSEAPEDLKHTFVVSGDISAEEHVWMQAVIQRFVDNSISKTCNFPETATPEDVEKVYLLAWELGCKGLTVYVTGSRQEVVLETKETSQKKSITSSGAVDTDISHDEEIRSKRPRPSVVIGRTHEIITPFGKAFITVNRNGSTNTTPFEVFVTIGKSGTDSAGFAEAIGRLISGWLRSAVNPNRALEEIAYQLQGIGGSVSVGFGANRVSSIPDAVSKILLNELELSKKMEEFGTKLLDNTNADVQKTLFESDDSELSEVLVQKQTALKNSSVCPECSNMSLIETEGCVKCQNCGYSRC